MFEDLEKILPIIEDLVKELKILNGHLFDFRKMIAPFLGWKVVKDKEEE